MFNFVLQYSSLSKKLLPVFFKTSESELKLAFNVLHFLTIIVIKHIRKDNTVTVSKHVVITIKYINSFSFCLL